jgi:hypothetical protein
VIVLASRLKERVGAKRWVRCPNPCAADACGFDIRLFAAVSCRNLTVDADWADVML